MALESYGPQFSKLEPTTKMVLQVDSSIFFYYERIEIYDKQYNDPIHIIVSKDMRMDIFKEVLYGAPLRYIRTDVYIKNKAQVRQHSKAPHT